MNDIAHKVTERLYDDDKVKYEFIFHWLTYAKKFFDALSTGDYDEYTKSLFEVYLDEYMVAMIEFFEDKFDLEALTDKMHKDGDRIPNINLRTLKKIVEIYEDENVLSLTYMEKLDKNSAKNIIWKRNFMEIIDRHAPLKNCRLGKAKTPWINKNRLAGKWQKNILKRKACKTNTPNDWKSYKVAKNQYNRLIKYHQILLYRRNKK